MRNIFIAIGGSGTRVAEALVRLLAIGFPINNDKDNGLLSSVGGTLEFWVVDPDIDSGATSDLRNCISEYQKLRGLLGEKWSIEIKTVTEKEPVRILNPLNLPGVNNQGKTLRSLLSLGGNQPSEPFLNLFYTPEELDIEINRGFYQKPFIGAAVMAIFADSLTKGRESGDQQDLFNQLKTQKVNFLLSGSLHGGTGASGLPVMGRFLRDTRKISEEKHADWKISACLLAPYCLPLGPPFDPLKQGEIITDELLKQKVSFFDSVNNEGEKPYKEAYESLGEKEQEQLIKQILLGFYAKPGEIVARAHQGVLYYQNNVLKQKGADTRAVFDEVYVVSKPRPTQLKKWSNGGKSQSNPLDSAETAAAVASLNFFSDSNVEGSNDYVVGASTKEREKDRLQSMHLYDLPHYNIGKESIDPERVFLVTSILVHFLLHEIPWSVPVKRWSGLEGLRRTYLGKDGETAKTADAGIYGNAATMIGEFMRSIVDPSTTIGWHPGELAALERIISVTTIENMEKGTRSDNETDRSLTLGQSSASISAFDMGSWYPKQRTEPLSKGEYMRWVWTHAYRLARTENQ